MVVLRAINLPLIIRGPLVMIGGLLLFASGFPLAIRSDRQWPIYIGGNVLGVSVGCVVGLAVVHHLPSRLLPFQIVPLIFGGYMIAKGARTA